MFYWDDKAGQNRTFAFALAIAACCHAVVFYLWHPSGEVGTASPRSLKIRLVSAPPEPARLQARPATETSRPNTGHRPSPPQAPPLTQAPAISGVVLYQRALESIRERSANAPLEAAPRSFSRLDFPRPVGPGPDSFLRPATLRFATRQAPTFYTDPSSGLLVRRQVDAFGNVSCSRQIGYAGDGNPPLWYPMPAGFIC